jgi:excisionase family DNA binding protein
MPSSRGSGEDMRTSKTRTSPTSRRAPSSPHPARAPRLADLPEYVNPEEAARVLRVSKNTMYELLRSGQIRSTRFGRVIRIPRSALVT